MNLRRLRHIVDLRDFSNGERPAPGDSAAWALSELRVARGYVAVAAVERPLAELLCFEWAWC